MKNDYIPPEELHEAVKAIKREKAENRRDIDWKQALRAVKTKTQIRGFDKQVAVTKEALSTIGKKEAKKKHREYLKTDKWKRRRKKKLEQEDYNCEKCGGNTNQCHHTTYRFLAHEDEEAEIMTLMAVCSKCHDKLEGKPVSKKRETPEKQQNSHLDDQEHREVLNEFDKKQVEDLKQMKKEEDEITSQRRRWFNRKIKQLEEQIEERQ